jgi:rod shape-determining protein MreD
MKRRPALPAFAETALLLGLGIVAVYAALIPLGPGGGVAPPDLLYCLAVAWVIRRPATAPLWLVLLLGLFADVMLSRPIGLGALGLVLATEAFRARRGLLHGLPFVAEWLAAAAAFAVVLGAMQLALVLTFADPPGLAASLGHLLATALAYPLLVAGLALGLNLRAPAAARHSLGRVR